MSGLLPYMSHSLTTLCNQLSEVTKQNVKQYFEQAANFNN